MDQQTTVPKSETTSFKIIVSEISINALAVKYKHLFRYGCVNAYSREGFTRTVGQSSILEVRIATKCPPSGCEWRRSTAREAIHIFIDLLKRDSDLERPKAIMTSCSIYSLLNYLREDFPSIMVECGKDGFGFSSKYEQDFKEEVLSFWVRDIC